MPWIQPPKTKPSRNKGITSSRNIRRGVVSVFAVAGLILACFIFFKQEPKPQRNETKASVKKTNKIKAVTPVKIKHTNTVENVLVKTNRLGDVYKVNMNNTYRDERGILRFQGGARVPNPKDFERATKVTQRSNIPKFKHRSESEIATLITIQPGGMLFGNPMYGEQFDQDFLNAVLDPTLVTEEDSERDRQIKELVAEAKKEMLERIKNGETPSSILKGEREELRRLSQYKKNLLSEVRLEVGNSENSDADIEDYISAANEILESKGIAPIKSGSFIRNRQRYLNLAARREAEAAANQEK